MSYSRKTCIGIAMRASPFAGQLDCSIARCYPDARRHRWQERRVGPASPRLGSAMRRVNELRESGLFKQWAIGGAFAFMYCAEPVLSYDIDVFCVIVLDGTPARVFSAEHALAVAVKTNRRKDRERIANLLESAAPTLDETKLHSLLQRYGDDPSTWPHRVACVMLHSMRFALALVLLSSAACSSFVPFAWQDSCVCSLPDGGVESRIDSFVICEERLAGLRDSYVCQAASHIDAAACVSSPICTCRLDTTGFVCD